ncbi:histidine kinase dimerization/phosphoacceptor domain -containing protein [Methylobacterium sp. sgz302541]|uniref:histidine kinase dimerization/phosphoacceptor domain -containing protein n=1 Tax=unclassified Methylobacterium TaxID=2615210 RepID=UPI003D336ABE
MQPSSTETGLIDPDALTADERDRLDIGVIGLDATGTVLSYNDAASAFSGLSASAVTGRNFFHDVAPATWVPAFYGRFVAGIRRGRLDERFEFIFGSQAQPLRARVRLSQGREAGRYWVVVEPLETLGAGQSREAVIAAVGQRSRAEPVDPSLCEREPIHLPGSIQPNAVLLASDADSFAITAHSVNIADMLPESGASLAGRRLGEVMPPAFVNLIRTRLAAGTLSDGRSLRTTVALPGADALHYAVVHAHAGRIIVELERAPDRPEDFGCASQLDVKTAVVSLRAAPTLAEAARIAACEIRMLTGFESVLVYRFDAEWNGEAIGEDKTDDWSRSLLGLRFPASDIPAQARALYTKARSRFVSDRDSVPVPLVATTPEAGNAPVDLSYAQNRTLSPIHLEYQRNLGVNGSMSVSILVDGALWGLMIGHHRRPHYVSPETRAAASVLTDAFAMRVQEIEGRRLWAERQAHLDIEARLVRRLTRSDDFVHELTSGPETLLDLFGATGAGILSGGNVTLIGRSPPDEAVRAIADWLKATLPAGETAYASPALGTVFPQAQVHHEIASGLLAAFVDDAREHLLLWFRPEVTSTVTWSGDPRKPVIAGSGSVAVLPRRSFERWVEERSGSATPFAEWQVSMAASFARAVEGVVLRQRRKIDELTGLLAEKERLLAQKDLLTREIDHRVKNSLQIVSAFLHMQRRQVTDPDARQAFAETAARVMSVARVHDSLYQAETIEEVDLGQTIENLCNDLVGMAGGVHAVDLTAEPGLMVPYRKAVALSLIATELVTNAFKYAAKPAGGSRVAVTVSGGEAGAVRLRVCDDGEGLPDDWAQARPRGTGLGMKLVRGMLDQIDARLEVANAPGACFTITA